MSAERERLREQLAALAHAQWSGWMTYQWTRCTREDDGRMIVPAEWVDRWRWQVQRPYEELSEAEKDSDRAEADRVLALIAPMADRLSRQRDHARAMARYRSGFGDEPPADLEPGDDDGWGLEP